MKKQVVSRIVSTTVLILVSASANAEFTRNMGANCNPKNGTTTTYTADGMFRNTSTSNTFNINCPVDIDIPQTYATTKTFKGSATFMDYISTSSISCTRSVIQGDGWSTGSTWYNSTAASGSAYAGGAIMVAFAPVTVFSATSLLYGCTVPPGGVQSGLINYVVEY